MEPRSCVFVLILISLMPCVRSAMDRVVERLEQQLATLRSGRASAGMLDRIQVRACSPSHHDSFGMRHQSSLPSAPMGNHPLCGGKSGSEHLHPATRPG